MKPIEGWSDVTAELYREYRFPGNEVVRIDAPSKLLVSDSGGHRVIDDVGHSHYIPTGWIYLHWQVKDGRAPFDF